MTAFANQVLESSLLRKKNSSLNKAVLKVIAKYITNKIYIANLLERSLILLDFEIP